ncbi:MAG: glutamate--tRNA ligase [Actinomycetota bacterium]|nr:glutamate--tRNA ligase [Actinomycetota bacterium]HZY66563.1 glutamate--tRNA ligase family protein [Rubrobacteraceae bacterium]
MSGVRVRFAPSPTGMLHPGGARTALFNYLFARYHGGSLVLRIEDTDRARSRREFEEAQLEDLRWLGLSFDEGPYRQSERTELYEKAASQLSEKGLVYEAADEEGRRALYFRPPARQGSFRDGLRGEVPFGKVGDFVIFKSDGTPSYNFAAVVDDLEMGISHVIRGEEHLSNTARQTLLYRALGTEEPVFIHLGLILGPDGKKLSKRHGAESITAYRDEGYLPEALINHLALLGWTHSEGREEFADLPELVREWDPSRCRASPATFDADRLLSLNAHHLRGLSPEELRLRLKPFLEEPLPEGKENIAVETLQQEMRLLSEAPRLLREIVGPVDPTEFVHELPESADMVFAHAYEALKENSVEGLESARGFVAGLRAWAKEERIKTRDLLHPLRLALTGRSRGPEIAYILTVLGAEEARIRIERTREARLRV